MGLCVNMAAPVGVTFSVLAGCRTFGKLFGCASSKSITRYLTSGVDADLPQKPKRPSGTFMIFSQEKRQQVSADNPNLSFPEIAKVIGRMWRELSEQEKESYRFHAKQNMENYMEEMAVFKASLTEEDVKMLAKQEEQSRSSKAKRRHKQEMKKLEKPKRPLTAYSIFLQSKLKDASGNVTGKMEAVGREWRQMSEDEKAAYTDSAARAKQVYETAMDNWEAKMVEKGNLSVVRRKSQLLNTQRVKKSAIKRQVTDTEEPLF